MKRSVNFFLLFCGALLFSCVGEDFVEDTNLLNERLSIVSSNTGTDTLVVGDSITYQAKFFNKMGEEEPRNLTWTSSRADIASIGADGKTIGLKTGVTNIQVSTANLIDSRLLLVQAVERVEIIATSTSIVQGDSLQLQAKYYDNTGNSQVVAFQWTSDNLNVLTVDNNGLVKGIIIGNANITASYQNSSGMSIANSVTMAVITDSNAIAEINIDTDTNQVKVNDTLRFRSTVKNLRGQTLNNHAPIVWASTDGTVLSIDGTGLATANDVGGADITASIGNVSSSAYNVLVSQAMQTSRSGTFSGRNGYRASGTVTMSEKSDGSLKLDFGSDFLTQNGPGIYVNLSNTESGGVEIQKMTQIRGPFTIDLPSNISIDDYNNVIIWCKPFGVAFGVAKLN